MKTGGVWIGVTAILWYAAIWHLNFVSWKPRQETHNQKNKKVFLQTILTPKMLVKPTIILFGVKPVGFRGYYGL